MLLIFNLLAWLVYIYIERERERDKNHHSARKKSKNNLLQTLGEKHYSTKTRGERTSPFCYCLGEGKYLLVAHKNHTHFIYKLVRPTKIKNSQEEFYIQKEGDYLVSVKNPKIGSELRGRGLNERQKVNYPTSLQEKFSPGYHFVPLNPADFLNYEGAEFLLIPKTKESLTHMEKKDSNLFKWFFCRGCCFPHWQQLGQFAVFLLSVVNDFW